MGEQRSVSVSTDDVRFLSAESPDAEAVKLSLNLWLLNSEKALIEMLTLCGLKIHLQWNVNAALWI